MSVTLWLILFLVLLTSLFMYLLKKNHDDVDYMTLLFLISHIWFWSIYVQVCMPPCRKFYPWWWVLVWSLVSCLWSGILCSGLLLCIIPLKLWLTRHSCTRHRFILISGLVCLLLAVLLPQTYHHHQHNPHHHHHPHYPHVHCQVTPRMLVLL